jgi:siroheme synthase (precorrin-2 oxidase/ferrochelatase)
LSDIKADLEENLHVNELETEADFVLAAINDENLENSVLNVAKLGVETVPNSNLAEVLD